MKQAVTNLSVSVQSITSTHKEAGLSVGEQSIELNVPVSIHPMDAVRRISPFLEASQRFHRVVEPSHESGAVRNRQGEASYAFSRLDRG